MVDHRSGPQAGIASYNSARDMNVDVLYVILLW